MLRKLLGTLLILLGLASAGLGVATATVWRDPDTVVATAVPQGDGTLVVTDPGVLELVSADVTVRATVPGGGPVALVIGRDLDVDGWVGIDHHSRVTGLTDWETLTTRAVVPEIPEPAEGQEAPTPGTGADPARNDMWVAEATGEGTATLRWDDRPGRWSLIAAGVGEDATAPTLELTWPREVTTEWLWRGVAAGAVLLLAGLAVLLIRRRKRPKDAATADDEPTSPTGTAADEPTPGDAGEKKPVIGSTWTPTLRLADTPATPPAPATGTEPATDGASSTDAASSADGAPAGGDDATDGAAQGAPDEAEPPARPPLLSRRSRRAAAQAATGATAVEDPVEPPKATASPEPARRLPFAPVRGSRQAAATSTPEPGSHPSTDPTAVPWMAPAPTPQSPAEQPEPGQEEPRTATGSVPRLTRRELRAQEEARKAAENPGIAGRLRALTGSIPVVRPTTSSTPVVPGSAEGQPLSRRNRSSAWRQTWGFDPEANGNGNGDPAGHNDHEGGNR